MNRKNNNDKRSETVKVLRNATVIYINGDREILDAIYITENGVYTGRITDDDKFMECGFISCHSIKKILNGSKKKMYKKYLN